MLYVYGHILFLSVPEVPKYNVKFWIFKSKCALKTVCQCATEVSWRNIQLNINIIYNIYEIMKF